MIGGAALYILCFLGFLFTKSALVASVCGFVSGVATSGFWDASGYPAVQEAYPAAPGSALIGIKFFVSVSGMIYPFLVVQQRKLEIKCYYSACDVDCLSCTCNYCTVCL